MIRVTVELVPQGVEHEKKEIGSMKIINNMTGTLKKGNYNVIVSGKESDAYTIKGFKRLELDVFDLIKAALNERE